MNIKKKLLIIVTLIIIFCNSIEIFATTTVLNTEESTQTIRNPERGFYKLVQVEMSKDEEDIESFEEEITDIEEENPDVSLISFQLNLKNYVTNTKIGKDKLKEIQQYFDIMRQHGYKVIFRVVYDSKGEENPEPEFNQILDHMDTLKEIYTDNEDILYVIEAGYLGSYGEWHDGKYDENKQYRNEIIKKLLEIVPSSITINLRKPSFITDFTTEQLNANMAYSETDIARLGLHNDGYLASKTDYGTYEEDEREESLLYQHNLTKYTIFGGECLKSESQYNDLENGIEDMQYRHCTYLNKTYDEEVKEKWRNTIFNSDTDVYSGKDGFKYIQDHLGYRFVVKKVDLMQEGNEQKINIQLENTGFGHLVNKKNVEIIYKQEDNVYYSKIDTDIRKDLSKEDRISNLNYTVKLPENMNSGEYEVYIKISEPYDSLKNNAKYSIQFANIDIWNEQLSANFIGNAKIDSSLLENNSSETNLYQEEFKDVYIRNLAIILLIMSVLSIVFFIVYRIITNKK